MLFLQNGDAIVSIDFRVLLIWLAEAPGISDCPIRYDFIGTSNAVVLNCNSRFLLLSTIVSILLEMLDNPLAMVDTAS